MLGVMEVFGRVRVLRRVTAAYMATFQAEAQMNPGISDFHALFANVRIGLRRADLSRMFALHNLPF